MAKQGSPKIVPLPLLKNGSIEDTLSGFAEQIDKNGHLGRRVERALTLLVAEIRGWEKVLERVGHDLAERTLSMTLDRVLEVVDGMGVADVSLSGENSRPVVTVSFGGDQHALRALVTAQAIREAAGRSLHPTFTEHFGVCIGINTGSVSETHMNGSGIEFNATGTTRMFAVRLQEFAGPDQIFISESTCRSVPASLDLVPIGSVRTSCEGPAEQAYLVRGLLRESR